MAADVKPPQTRWDTVRVKRTEAMPKTTLFGSNLERKTDKEMDDIKKIDLKTFDKEQAEKGTNRRVRVRTTQGPTGNVQGQDYLDHTKDEVKKQKERAHRMNRMLDVLEEKTKYFAVGSIPQISEEGEKKEPNWMSSKDLENAGAINKVGLTKDKSSYNRDRYRKRPQVHQYSLIGDPLKPGMEFAEKEKDVSRPPVHQIKETLPESAAVKTKLQFYGPTFEAKTAIDVPANILHSYGTLVCNQLLGDKKKVDQTLAEQDEVKKNFQRKQKREDFVLPPVQVDPIYQELGHKLRQDFFPGHTYNHHTSLAKEIYTKDVFDRRYKDPDEYRYQKDQHSKWAEQDVMRGRVAKAWNEYLTERSAKKES